MSKVFALFHIVFATNKRLPSLHDANRKDLHSVITSIVGDKQSRMISINSVTDHIHMFVNLSPNISLSDFMAAVKSKSSSWLKHDTRTTMFKGGAKVILPVLYLRALYRKQSVTSKLRPSIIK